MNHESEEEELHDRPEPTVPRPPEGLPWSGIVGTLVLVLVVVFAVQNTDSVEVRFLWMSRSAPLAIVITVSAVGAVLFAALGGRFLRRRRLQRWEEQEALKRLRNGS